MKLTLQDREGHLALVSYCASSVLMTVFNKYVLSSLNYRKNFLLLFIQCSISLLLVETLHRLGLLRHRPLNYHDAHRWFPISLLLVLMIYTASKSLQHLTVAMFSVFKNVTIILMALLESHLYGKPIRALKWTAFGLIVASSVVGGFHDLSFSALGYVWMALNCLSSAAYGLGMQAVIKQVAFENGDTMFFNNLLASPVILVLSVLREHPFAPDSRSKENAATLWPVMLTSGVLAFAINYCTAWCMRVVSPTSHGMVGALNKTVVAFSGMLFIPSELQKCNAGTVFSIILGGLSGYLYSLAQEGSSTGGPSFKPVPPSPRSSIIFFESSPQTEAGLLKEGDAGKEDIRLDIRPSLPSNSNCSSTTNISVSNKGLPI